MVLSKGQIAGIATGVAVPVVLFAAVQAASEIFGKEHNAVHWTIVRSQFAYFAHKYREDAKKGEEWIKQAFAMAQEFVENPTREESFFAVSGDNGATWEFTKNVKRAEGAAKLTEVAEDGEEPKQGNYTGEDAETAFNTAHKIWEEACAKNKKTRDENADKLKAFKKGKFYKANWSAVKQFMVEYFKTTEKKEGTPSSN